MNTLEKEIQQTMIDNRYNTLSDQTTALASVAMKWIEKAFNDAYVYGLHDGSRAEYTHNYNNVGPNYSKEMWLKENGLTSEPTTVKETEPVIGSNGIISTDQEI